MSQTAVERIGRKVAKDTDRKGFAELARICGVHASQPSHWNRPTTEANGRGGSIPDRYHSKILAYCRDNSIPIRKGDLVNG